MLQKNYSHRLTSARLLELMKERGFNNSTFAKEVGITEGAVRKLIDEDKPFNPKTETLVRIADVLNVPIKDIIMFEDD